MQLVTWTVEGLGVTGPQASGVPSARCREGGKEGEGEREGGGVGGKGRRERETDRDRKQGKGPG